MRFSERFKMAALTESADVTSSGVDSYSVHMGKLHAGCWQVNFGSITADDTLKVYVGASGHEDHGDRVPLPAPGGGHEERAVRYLRRDHGGGEQRLDPDRGDLRPQ